MSERDPLKGTRTWPGIVLGVVALAAVASFVVFLPHDDAEDDSAGDGSADEITALSLPDRLAGGFVASDLEEAFADSQLADQAEQIAAAQAKNRAYADRVLAAVLDEPVASRDYAGPDLTSQVSVQVFAAPGGAFAPVSLPDPSTVDQSQGTQRFLRVGDAACQVTVTGQGSVTGAAADEPVQASCQQTREGVTAQVSAQGLRLPQVEQVIDAVLDSALDSADSAR